MASQNSIIRLQIDNFTDNMWGGDWIPRLKGLAPPPGPVGESWEFSAHPLHPSRIESGAAATLPELLAASGAAILGENVARRLAGAPPFLLKFIDSRDELSVQVHPTDDYARDHENDAGKTESWVVLDADGASGGGHLYLGFDPRRAEGFPDQAAFAEAFLGAIGQANAQGPSDDPAVREKAERLVLPFLNRIPVRPGDVYHVPPGTIHAIGRGVRLFEIQQSSDVTYRVWDWNRPDAAMLREGRKAFRPLHLERAREVLDFHARPADAYRLRPAEVPSDGGGPRQRLMLVREPGRHYAAERLRLESGSWMGLAAEFSVLTAVAGSVGLEAEGKPSGTLRTGSSVIVPASASGVRLVCAGAGAAEVIRSVLPLSV